jgi:myo-inositol-1(or 4)-monophosphatase
MNQDAPQQAVLQIALDAANAGAQELIRHRDSFSVREKAKKDLVTSADLASQRAIFARLRAAFPDHHMMGEEEGHDAQPIDAHGKRVEAPIWIVDPLDGTLNYVHQLQNYCVSIALFHQDRLQVGVIVDPVCQETFTAVAGQGAYLSRGDDSPPTKISVSNCTKIEESLLACSFPAGAKKDSIEAIQFCEVLERCQALRRLGSCALNLCYVAAGRLDGYWARSVKAWDMAAGALIVQEAGGVIGHINGGPLDVWDPKFCAAASQSLQDQLLKSVGQSKATE